MQIEFVVAGHPKGQPRPKAFVRGKRAAVYDPGTAEGWKGQIALAAKPFLPSMPLQGPLELSIEFSFLRPKSHYGTSKGTPYLKDCAPTWHTSKPDLDNLAKAVMDALTQLGLWLDDQQVSKLVLLKRYCDKTPGALINIKKII